MVLFWGMSINDGILFIFLLQFYFPSHLLPYEQPGGKGFLLINFSLKFSEGVMLLCPFFASLVDSECFRFTLVT